MTVPAGSVARRTLQRATRPAHERLHENAAFAALLRGDLALTAYKHLLLRLLGLHRPIEEGLARLPADPLLTWRAADGGLSRTALISRDLAALGLDPREIEAAPHARALLPALADTASALGAAWVVEGSALGGRVMSRKVDTILARADAPGGGSFFAADPDQPARWLGCCEAVETCGASADGLAAMTRTATATFAAFEAWLEVPACV